MEYDERPYKEVIHFIYFSILVKTNQPTKKCRKREKKKYLNLILSFEMIKEI